MGLVPASVTAVFDILPRCGKSRTAVFADTFTAPVHRSLLPVEFCAAVWTTEQSVCSPGLKLFPAAFAGQLKRLADGVFAGLYHLVAFPALDTMPVQGRLPLFFLWGKLRDGEVKPPDKLQIDLDLLRSVAVYFLRGMDDD